MAYAKTYNTLCDSTKYAGVIAIIDMFMFRFPQNAYAGSIVSTISSRLKSCSILNSLAEVAKSVGLVGSQLLEFVVDDPVADDVLRVSKRGEEPAHPYSYSNYLHDFRLVVRSPYSAAANKNYIVLDACFILCNH